LSDAIVIIFDGAEEAGEDHREGRFLPVLAKQ
jgi:hypothetical protein